MLNFRLYLGNLKSQLQSRLISDQEERLWYVHVGKTGGISVGKAVRAEVVPLRVV